MEQAHRLADAASLWTERLDDSALTYDAMAATGEHALKLGFQRPERLYPPAHLYQAFRCNGVDTGAGTIWSILKVQKLTDRLDPKAEFASMADEPKTTDIVIAEKTAIALRAISSLKQPNLFVVTDCRHLHAGA